MPVKRTAAATGSTTKRAIPSPFTKEMVQSSSAQQQPPPRQPEKSPAVVKLLPPIDTSVTEKGHSRKHSTASSSDAGDAAGGNGGHGAQQSGRRSARDELKYAISQVIVMGRLSGELRSGGKAAGKPTQAPFGPGTLFARVRACLDPTNHRHLLGEDNLIEAARMRKGKTTKGASERGSDGSTTETSDDENDEGLTPAEVAERLRIRNLRRRLRLAEQRRRKRDAADSVSNIDCEGILDGELSEDDGGPDELRAAGHHLARVAGKSGIGGASVGREALPRGEDVAQLPPELAQTLMSVAEQRLRTFLYPRLLMRKRRAARVIAREQAIKQATRPTPDMLRKAGQMFREWPQEALQQLCSSFVFHFADAGEVVLYQGEPVGSGIWLLTHGSVQLFRRNKTRRSGNNEAHHASAPLTHATTRRATLAGLISQSLPSNAGITVVATLTNLACFNEFQFITEEPRLHSVRTTTRCDLWCLPRPAYEQITKTLPADVRAATSEHCFRKRMRTIPLAYPMTHAHLRASAVFQRSSEAVLDAVLDKLEPLAAHAGFQFAGEGEPIQQIIFVRRGRVGAHRAINGERLHVNTHSAPFVLLDSAGLHHQVSSETYLAITDCDLFTLSLAHLDQILAAHPGEREKMFAASREQHMQQLSMQQIKFRPLIFSIPIVRTLLRHEHIGALAYLFEGRVYPPLSVICSRADMCDRVIILVKGRVSLGKDARWAEGEAIGYTCVLRHRWPEAAVAVEASECIELPRRLFVAFLKDCGAYDVARQVAEGLMFPNKDVPIQPDIRKRRKLYAYGTNNSSASVVTASTTSEHPLNTSSSAAKKDAVAPAFDQMMLRVRDHVMSLKTPPMFPIFEGREGYNGVAQGLTTVHRLEDFGVDARVMPGSIYNLTRAEKEQIVSQVAATFRPEEQRRLTHVTKFLMIKEKRATL